MAPRRLPRAIPWLAAVAMGGVVGCFPPQDGQAPPLDRIYFPVGIALGPGPASARTGSAAGVADEPTRFLYVANSDFDLQFNAGSVQAYDLDRLRGDLPRYCTADADCVGASYARCDLGASPTHEPTHWCVPAASPCLRGTREQTLSERLTVPGRCSEVEPSRYRADSVSIGAFVTDVVYRANPHDPAQGRLFLPVRGDDTLHWIDVADAHPGKLHCNDDGSGKCDENHRRGQDPSENTRGEVLPPEPYGIAADRAGEAIVTTHQSSGEVALFVNNWGCEAHPPSGSTADGGPGCRDTEPLIGPTLQFVVPNLPSGALAVASVPKPGWIARFPNLERAYEPGFLVTFRNAAQVSLVRYFAAPGELRPFLDATLASSIATNSQGFTSPGIAVDDAARNACVASCAPTDRACLVDCSLDVYVTNRTPATIIFGKTQADLDALTIDDRPRFYDSKAVGVGVSRVIVGDVIDQHGTPARRLFLVCFDSHQIFIYDPDEQRFEARIQTGRGPQAFAVDTVRPVVASDVNDGHALGYVGHFTDSYLGVIDLDERHVATFGKIILNVGQATPPRASK